MKRIAHIAVALLLAGPVLADPPAPYPVTVNSKADTVASITAYRANPRTYRVSFTDGVTASVVTSRTPFMAWATNSSATTYSTANWAYVSGTTGQVDFTFAPAAVNYAAGRYVYEVGVKNGTIPTVYRQGVFIIQGSPIAQGVGPVTWSSNINWSLFDYTGTSGYGPVRPDNSTIICTTNADGSITIAATGVGGATWASVSGKPTIITELAATNGVNLKALNATQLTSGTVPLARLSGITSNQIASATDAAYRNTTGALTNVLAAVQSTSNQVAKVGNLVRVTFNTNYVSPAWLALQGYHDAAQLTGTLANARLDADLQRYAVNDLGSGTNLDHGSGLVGLLDDDHTQYLLANGNRVLAASNDTWTAYQYKPGGVIAVGFYNDDHGGYLGWFGSAYSLVPALAGYSVWTSLNGMSIGVGNPATQYLGINTTGFNFNSKAASNFTATTGATWNGNGVDYGVYVSNRYDSVRVPFVATSGVYNVIHLGRWRSSASATLYGLEGKVDNSTCSVRIAEQTFASTAYATPASTNNQITLDTNGAIDDTFTDATWNTNNELFAVLYNVGACTNGEFTLFWKW